MQSITFTESTPSANPPAKLLHPGHTHRSLIQTPNTPMQTRVLLPARGQMSSSGRVSLAELSNMHELTKENADVAVPLRPFGASSILPMLTPRWRVIDWIGVSVGSG